MSKVEIKIEKIKKKIERHIDRGWYESALGMIMGLSAVLYNYNQWYRDDFLEDSTSRILAALQNKNKIKKEKYQAEKNTVLFYDGMGFDTRGLALIYVKALCEIGYKVIYVTEKSHRGKTPTIDGILGNHGAKKHYIKLQSIIKMANQINDAFTLYKPEYSFIYTTPYDLFGILAFMNNEGNTRRFMINQTDHAYWIGVNSFDKCIEFRDYGASVSIHNRRIDENKVVIQPFYPYVDESVEFEGYPFDKEEDDIVVFSGGALYKTIDENNTYYKWVSYILENESHVKFWYAGAGDDTKLRELMDAYPTRVFHTAERKDLYQVLKHSDIYLNTYPMVGGLMMQYAAKAGVVPLTLRHNNDGDGFLIDQTKIGVEFDNLEEIQNASIRWIKTEKSRDKKTIEEAIISESDFGINLRFIVEKGASSYHHTGNRIDTSVFLSEYKQRFDIKSFNVLFFNRYNIFSIALIFKCLFYT